MTLLGTCWFLCSFILLLTEIISIQVPFIMSLELFYFIIHKVLYGLSMCPCLSELFLQDTLFLSDSQESVNRRVLDFKASWILLSYLLNAGSLKLYTVPELLAVVMRFLELTQIKPRGAKPVRALSPRTPGTQVSPLWQLFAWSLISNHLFSNFTSASSPINCGFLCWCGVFYLNMKLIV